MKHKAVTIKIKSSSRNYGAIRRKWAEKKEKEYEESLWRNAAFSGDFYEKQISKGAFLRLSCL